MRINGWVAGWAAIGLLAGCAQDRGQVRQDEQTVMFGQSPEIGVDENEARGQGGSGMDASSQGAPESDESDAAQGATVTPPPLEGGVQVGAAISGTVLGANAEVVRIQDPEGNVYRLNVDERSTQSPSISQGEPVRASFVLRSGDMFLREIEPLDEQTWKAEQEAAQDEGGTGFDSP